MILAGLPARLAPTRRNGVDPDAVGRQLAGAQLGERNHAVLGGGIACGGHLHLRL